MSAARSLNASCGGQGFAMRPGARQHSPRRSARGTSRSQNGRQTGGESAQASSVNERGRGSSGGGGGGGGGESAGRFTWEIGCVALGARRSSDVTALPAAGAAWGRCGSGSATRCESARTARHTLGACRPLRCRTCTQHAARHATTTASLSEGAPQHAQHARTRIRVERTQAAQRSESVDRRTGP